MSDTRGFYQKYNVTRVDGREITGPTFTLELDHDPFAGAAIKAYIRELRATNEPKWEGLASDLEQVMRTIEGITS